MSLKLYNLKIIKIKAKVSREIRLSLGLSPAYGCISHVLLSQRILILEAVL